CRGCYDGNGSMSTSDSMNFFPAIFLIESNRSQDGCQDHPWAVNPGQSLVQSDGPTNFGSRNFGRADGKISAQEIQVRRRRAERHMHITVCRIGAPAPSEGASDDRGDQRSGGYQTEPLMDLKHMRPLVEPRLSLGISLGLSRREAEVLQRKHPTQ